MTSYKTNDKHFSFCMEKKSQTKKCTCDKITQVGLWDGEDQNGKKTGGPSVKCDDCDYHFNLTWEKWNEIPDENKTSLV